MSIKRDNSIKPYLVTATIQFVVKGLSEEDARLNAQIILFTTRFTGFRSPMNSRYIEGVELINESEVSEDDPTSC